jgi:hypothetical protein
MQEPLGARIHRRMSICQTGRIVALLADTTVSVSAPRPTSMNERVLEIAPETRRAALSGTKP